MADIRINSLPSTATSFNTDDYIPIDGASGGTRKMLAATLPLKDVTLGGSSGPSVKSTLSARAPRQGLVFDGTTGATFGGVTFGSSDFTVSVWISVNSLSGNNVIIDSIGGGNNFALYVATDGSIRRLDRSTSTTASTAAGVISVGKTYLVTYVRGAFYINGVLQNTFSDTSNYSTSMARIGWAASSDSFCTGLFVPLIYNRALSASEVVALYEAGAPAGADYNSASNTSIITGANSDFSSDTGYWTKGNGATISGGKANLTGGANSNIYRASLTVAGKRYRMTVTVDAADSVAYISDGNVTTLVSGTAAGFGTTGTKTFEFTVPSTSSTGIQIISTSGTLVLDNLLLYPIGLLLAPDAAQAGGGLTWYDTSGNAANITLPASGVSWNVPFAGYLTAPTTTNLTLNGGSTGASFVLGQGATAANATILPKGTGSIGLATSSATLYGKVATALATATSPATIASGSFDATYATFGGVTAASGSTFGIGVTSGGTSGTNLVSLAAGSDWLDINYYGLNHKFYSFGAEKSRFTSTGNLLIGTTTDGGQKLQVEGNAKINSTGATTRALSVTNSLGNVDIGVFGASGIGYVGTTTATDLQLFAHNAFVLGFDSAKTATFSGAITLPNGTAAAPSTRWAGGASTGLYNYDDGFVSGIGFSLGGTYKMRLASTGLEVVNNLTVSGTGNSSVAGTWLIGTTTNSGNGMLQLATHTTSAGGIGFGTADSLYTAGVGDLRFKTTSAEAAITLLSGGAYIGSVTAGKSTFIISGTGSTALTLDSSQNATFAGSIRQNQANNISLTSGVATTIFSLGTSAGVYIVTATLDVNAVAGYAIVGKGATGSWQVLANSGTQMSFSMSTNDLQITQSSGSTSTTNTFNLLRLR